MTEEQRLMRQGVKRLPLDMLEAMRKRRDTFGTQNPHVFDYVYDDREHYRVILEFERIETGAVGSKHFRLVDHAFVEYAETLGNEPRRYAMSSDDYTCMVKTLNGGNNPLYTFQGVHMQADYWGECRCTVFDMLVIFTVDGNHYLIGADFDLKEEMLRSRPDFADSSVLHEWLCGEADKRIWDKTLHACGRYVSESLCGEARTTLRNLLQMGSAQTQLRNDQSRVWERAALLQPLHHINIDFQSRSVKRRRNINLWGEG